MAGEYVRVLKADLEALANEIAIRSCDPVGLTVKQMAESVKHFRPALQPVAVGIDEAEQTIYPGIGYEGIESVTVGLSKQEYARPELYVDEEGVIHAVATQEEGIVEGGEYETTTSLPVMRETRITPGEEEQVAVPAGTYVVGDIIVEASGAPAPGEGEGGISEEILQITENGLYDVSGYRQVYVMVAGSAEPEPEPEPEPTDGPGEDTGE